MPEHHNLVGQIRELSGLFYSKKIEKWVYLNGKLIAQLSIPAYVRSFLEEKQKQMEVCIEVYPEKKTFSS